MIIEMTIPPAMMKAETLTPGFLAVQYVDWTLIYQALCSYSKANRSTLTEDLCCQVERNIKEADVKARAYKTEFFRHYDMDTWLQLLTQLTDDPFFDD